ncbi:MAG TPA: ABC transporter substrate-binding protein [Stellaceae bacterium]|nr:ABC transporter substrate-binding protein [Stellaceae bacterium]
MLKRMLRLAALLVICVSGVASAAEASDPKSFVADMGSQAIHILQTQHDLGSRKAAFTKLFAADFDSATIGKFVLGRYWRTATPDQQKQYIDVFSQYVVALYANRFAGYSGEQFKVVSSRQGDSGNAVVMSQIIPTDSRPPINIGWQVSGKDNTYRIVDVTVENLSLAVTKRDEFASVIQQNNGSVQALIDQLKQKVQES